MLTTGNSGGLVAGGAAQAGRYKVEMLIGTYVRSLGRDTQPGEIVEVDDADYRFLKPYKFCKDAVEGSTPTPVVTNDEGEVETDEDEDTEPIVSSKPKGKRK